MDEEDLDFVRRLGAPAAAFLLSLDATEALKCGISTGTVARLLYYG